MLWVKWRSRCNCSTVRVRYWMRWSVNYERAMEHILIIAYGNPLRCDDGIAWQAAEELKREFRKSAEIICVHQLTPELVEDLSRADLVIFLDASSNGEPGEVRCKPIFAQSGEGHLCHHFAPTEILGVCERLYSIKPRAFLISVHGKCFDHGHELTPTAIQAVPKVVARVRT